MKRSMWVGACAAIMLLGAVLTASAFGAEAPEIGRCVKVAAGTGQFTTSACSKKAKPTKLGEYEFEPGAIKTHFIGTGGAATLETVHAVKVTCGTERSSGEFTSSKTVGNVEVVFTGCESLRYKCSTPMAAEGEIVTNALAGKLVWEKFGKKVAIDLFPQSTELFVEFQCGPVNAKVKGSVLCALPVDKMEPTLEEKFTAKKGKQKPEYYYASPTEKIKDVLMSKIGGPGIEFEQAGQTVTNVQTDEESLEVNTVV